VVNFLEKPADPPGLPDNPAVSLANMGVYVWRTEALVAEIIADAKTRSSHDFGKDILPSMAAAGKPVYAFSFMGAGRNPNRYWRDIGTIGSYWQAHMDLVSALPELDLYDPDWPIYTYKAPLPPAKVTCGSADCPTDVCNVLLTAGCIVSGARVRDSVLSPGTIVQAGAEVTESVLMDEVVVGAGARLHRVIVDEGVSIPPGYQIGFDRAHDGERFTLAEPGLTVVPPRAAFD